MPTKAEEYLANAEVPIEFESAREEILIRQAAHGQDAKEFLLSPIGRFISGAAAQDQSDIEAKLAVIKPNTPWRRRRITELQTEHDAISRAIAWLCEQVNIGAGAERVLLEPSE